VYSVRRVHKPEQMFLKEAAFSRLFFMEG